MDDLTLTTAVLFFFAVLQMGPAMLNFDRFREEKPTKQKQNHFQNLAKLVDFSKPFIATKQSKQNESKLILI